ncbi:hypothetical protein [Roseospira goensis]|uniref:Uncharacterized protein n=1 Tax=Roseospira goensis TaxID=391922 RepID=A0A7W6S165_9PROT|nr:hypothetical protein [Roseospira goensis]MBB4286811.1 hypothetical protein [Roseospira goensis]
MGDETLTEAVAQAVADITNVVGHIERNIAAYHAIRDRQRARAFRDGLQALLVETVGLRGPNIRVRDTIFDLERKIAATGGTDAATERIAEADLRAVLAQILGVRDVLHTLDKDLIAVDYRTYERLDDALQGRATIVRALLDPEQRGRLSPQRLRDLGHLYARLIDALETCKARLDDLLRQTDPNPARDS